MPVLPEETQRYTDFTRQKAKDLGTFDYSPETTLWHYTSGAGLLGIIESASIRATQVSCVNDSTETLYATRLFRNAILALKEKSAEDQSASAFLDETLRITAEPANMPAHAPSPFFVACFSELEDDLNQWLKYGGPHGENGYAIGFVARGLQIDPNTAVVRVSYDKGKHEAIAAETAEATLAFFREGLVGERMQDPAKWGQEFFESWDRAIYRLSPMAKDECFKAEQEFRMVHELQTSELPNVRFQQKENMLARHIDLETPVWMQQRTPKLPIVKVMIGPGRHQEITRVGVMTLLNQMGYQNIEVLLSKRPVQRP